MASVAEMRRLDVEGLEVALAGTDDAPLLILTRMASRAAGIWDPLAHRLARRFLVASFDLRMPALTQLDEPRELFRGYARECAAIASALDRERYRVIGWNGGSHVALRCTVDDPARVRGCVLIGAFHPLPDMRSVERGIDFMSTMLKHADPELYACYWFMSGLSPDFVEQRFDEIERLARRRAGADGFMRTDPERLDRWIRVLRGQWTSNAELAAIAVPVCVLQPELDRWHAGPTVAMGRRLAALIRGARMEVLEGVGSLAPLEVPDLVAGRIVECFRDG